MRLQLQKISDEDSMHLKTTESMHGSLQSQVPAQDYERDILPRYKEALHIGLSSCKDHFRSKGRSTTSVFRVMALLAVLDEIFTPPPHPSNFSLQINAIICHY